MSVDLRTMTGDRHRTPGEVLDIWQAEGLVYTALPFRSAERRALNVMTKNRLTPDDYRTIHRSHMDGLIRGLGPMGQKYLNDCLGLQNRAKQP